MSCGFAGILGPNVKVGLKAAYAENAARGVPPDAAGSRTAPAGVAGSSCARDDGQAGIGERMGLMRSVEETLAPAAIVVVTRFTGPLRPATMEDLEEVVPCMTTPEELRYWGGPALSFPAEPDRLWKEIHGASDTTFVMDGRRGLLAAFGQVIPRDPYTVHLARIFVAPHERGKGAGRALCACLIEEGTRRYRPARFTLNVYRDNAQAVRLYGGLGFVVSAEDPTDNSFKMILERPRRGPGGGEAAR